jgi:predicted RNase H-like HicB family nuclease
MAASAVKGGRLMAHYYAIAEPGEGGTWWISFPGRDGIVSAADDAREIVSQAQDALESVAMHGGRLPPAIEDGATPPADLSEFGVTAMVVVIPFAAPVTRAAAD